MILRRSRIGVALVLPSVLVFLGFVAVPLVAVVGLSFTRWTGYDIADIGWEGLGNYEELLSDPILRRALFHTLVFTVATTLLLNLVGFGYALLIDTKARGSSLLKAALMLPVVLSPVLVGLIWSRLLDAFGTVNQLLERLGLVEQPVFFLGDPDWVLASIIVATVWQFAGYDMILYLAALQGVPRDQIEAAAVDGARAWTTLFRIVVPALYPVIGVVVLLNVIGGLRIFDIVWVMTKGGPDRASEVMATYMYQQAFQISSMGYASTIAVGIVFLSLLAAVARLRFSRG